MPELFKPNQQQRQAAEYSGGPLIVLAGPGTGKTSVIVLRVARLIRDDRVEPESILALTFTNKAADELRRRLADAIGSETRAGRVVADTFHSFGLRFIRRFADLEGLHSEPKVIDEAQQRAFMRKVVQHAGLRTFRRVYDPDGVIRDALGFIASARNRAIFPEAVDAYVDAQTARLRTPPADMNADDLAAALARLAIVRENARLYRDFEEECRKLGVVTLDELQTLPLRLFRNEQISAIARSDYAHIVVDEFQDVNQAQIELLKRLAGPTHDLCVVGDDDQAIYAFRGSRTAGFREFEHHWKATTTIELSHNYRSTTVVLNAAAQIIKHCTDRFRPDKRTTAAGPNAALDIPIEAVTYAGLNGAGPAIGGLILRAVESGDSSFRDFAVLARTNKFLESIAASLEVMEIPIEMPERARPFSHPLVSDVLGWLRLLADDFDEAHAIRLLARPPYGVPITTLAQWSREHAGIAERPSAPTAPTPTPFIDRVIDWNRHPAVLPFARRLDRLRLAARTDPIDDLTLKVIQTTGALTVDPVDPATHRARIERVGRFLAFVRNRIANLDQPRRVAEFLRYFDDLVDSGAGLDIPAADRLQSSGVEFSDRDAVRLLTAHRAKGLEFDTVFIPRVNSPHGYPNRMSRTEEQFGRLPDELIGGERVEEENEERRLFFVAMTRARRKVVLLAQAKDDRGRKTSPSDYWKQIVDAGAGAGFTVTTLDADRLIQPSDQASHADTMTLPADMREESARRQREKLRLRREVYSALHEAHDPALPPDRLASIKDRLTNAAMRLPLLAAADDSQIARLLAAALPQDRSSLAQYADMIRSQDRNVAPAPAPIPPLQLAFSEIETYLRCPQCFWLKSIVKWREPVAPKAWFGQVIHRSLESFYTRWRESKKPGSAAAPPTLNDLLAFGRRASEEIDSTGRFRDDAGLQRVDAALRTFHETLHRDTANPLHLEIEIPFRHAHAGHSHRLTTRIDRIDRDSDGRYRLIDYKSGKPTLARLHPEPKDLQLGMYLMALRALLETDHVPGTAEYWHISTGERGVIDLDKIKLEKITNQINDAIDAILAGRWDRDEHCQYCLWLDDVVGDDDAATPGPSTS